MRSTRNQPFCWQEKKVLRLLRDRYKKSELVKLRALYCTITEIDSDFNSKSINYYTKTISTYSGLSTEWIPKGLKILSDLGILNIIDHREGGKFIGKELIFTPENVKEMPPKTVHGKTGNGKTVYGKTATLEDSSLKEDNFYKEDIPPNSRGDEYEKEKKDFQVNNGEDSKPENQSHGVKLKKPVVKIPPYYTPEFETFWKTYPSRNGKKNGKKLAFKSWCKVLAENDFGYDYLSERISILKESYGDYAPDASVWLNNARWEDEYQPPVEYTKEGYVATPIEIKWDVVGELKKKREAKMAMENNRAGDDVNVADIY